MRFYLCASLLLHVTFALSSQSDRQTAIHKYVQHWDGLLVREYQDRVADLRDKRKSWTRRQLEQNGISIFDATAEPDSEVLGEKVLRIEKRDFSFRDRFSRGDVLLVTPNVPNVDPIPKEGLVVDVGKDWMTLGVGSSWPVGLWEARKLAGFYRIRLDRTASQAPLKAQRDALERLRRGLGGSAAELMTRLEGGESESVSSNSLDDIVHALNQVQGSSSFQPNKSQREAILWALQRELSLIRGPPGTGKTRVAALLVATALRLEHNPRVLAVAHSNGAADVLLGALLDMGVPAVRLGRPASVSASVHHRTLVAMADKLPMIVELRSQISDATLDSQTRSAAAFELRQAMMDAQAMILDMSPVVVTSCIGAHQLLSADEPDSEGSKFSLVVLDEAAQTTEPSFLCALVAARAEQVVMVGDTKQLPPTITSMDLVDTLGISPMARAKREGVAEFTLQEQYRMPAALLEHPSNYFYKGLVKCAPERLSRVEALPTGFPWPTRYPLAFVHLSETEVAHTFGGRSNPAEADLVGRIVEDLVAGGDIGPSQVAVISPYSKQVQLIRSLLARRHPDIRVGTVDSFQGQETDIVVISTVRSNPLKELGFLRDPRRLCVSITRSRRGLVVVGDSTCLRACHHWSALLDSIDKKGCRMEASAIDRGITTKEGGRGRSVPDRFASIEEDPLLGLFS